MGVQTFLNKSGKLEKYRFFKAIGVNNLIIVCIMVMFSLFGAIFGMSEETIAFVVIFVPLAISMGYDSITGVCLCFLAAGLGFAGCVLNHGKVYWTIWYCADEHSGGFIDYRGKDNKR